MNLLAHRRAAGFVLALLCGMLSSSALADGELHIRGRVLNQKGKPVAGTPVFAVCIGALPEGPHLDCGFPGMTGRKTTTDEEGAFRLERLPLAVYSVYAAILAKDNGGTASEAAQRVELRQSLDGLELRAPPPPPLDSILGTVVDGSGEPVAGAHVWVYLDERHRPKGLSLSAAEGSVLTDAQGRFELKGMAIGLYSIGARKEGFEDLTLREGGRPGKSMTLKLTRCVRVVGRAVGPDGAPVTLQQHHIQIVGKPSEGRFEIRHCGDGLKGTNFTVKAEGMASLYVDVPVQPGTTLDMGDVRMEPARLLRVHVTERGQPVSGARVQLDEVVTSSVETDTTGWATLADQPDKAGALRVWAQGRVPARVKVAKGQAEVRVALETGLGMSGQAVDATGKPLLGSVSVGCPDETSAQTQLNPQGGFQIARGLQAGVCLVAFQTYSSPIASFEQSRWVWLDPKTPLHVEYREAAQHYPLHVRFEGEGTPHRAVLLTGDAPAQLRLEEIANRSLVPSSRGMPEMFGHRVGKRREDGMSFREVAPGDYTLVVVMADGVFRAPITVGPRENTVTVSIPGRLTPLPKPKSR